MRLAQIPSERTGRPVITVTRLDGAELVVNAELIELRGSHPGHPSDAD